MYAPKIYPVKALFNVRSVDHAAVLIASLVTLVVMCAGSIVVSAYHFFWWGLAIICASTFVITYFFTQFVIKRGNLIETATAKITTKVEQLEEIDHYRREYFSNFAHEIKTPVFNVQGYISTLLDGALDDEKVNRLYLERAEKSTQRIVEIVNYLEEISRLESGEPNLEYGRFDVVELAREIADALEMDARTMKIRVSIVPAKLAPIYVVADRKYIAQVFTNLLSNSIRYGSEGGWTRISFADVGQNRVRVDVADNGTGIDKEDLPMVFDRFFRTDTSRSRAEGGTGLGLAIVRHIVEAHGETISIDSELGVGSTFSFTLSKN